jgi:hypothetical protein
MVLLGCALWMSSFVGSRIITPTTENSPFVESLQWLLIPNSLLSNLVGIAFTLLNALLLGQINNRFTIIRTRTFLPVFIFIMLMGSWYETHLVNGSHLALTLFLFALFYIFGVFRDIKASEQAFMGSFLLACSSIIINPLIFLIPVCWLGLIMFQSFSLRTFLASIFGTLSPWILYLAFLFLTHLEFNPENSFYLNFYNIFEFSTLSLPSIIYIASLVIILLIGLQEMYSNFHSEAIQSRTNLNFILLLLVSLTILSIVFHKQYSLFLPFVALLFSFLVSHSFSLKQNNFYGIVFIIFCVLNIALIISNYILF